MKRLAALLCAGTLALASAGCAFNDDLRQAITDLSSPAAQQAAVNVKQFVGGLACATSAASLVAAGVEKQLAENLVAANNTVYVASAATCTVLGGTLLSSTPVTAATVVSIEGK